MDLKVENLRELLLSDPIVDVIVLSEVTQDFALVLRSGCHVEVASVGDDMSYISLQVHPKA